MQEQYTCLQMTRISLDLVVQPLDPHPLDSLSESRIFHLLQLKWITPVLPEKQRVICS